MIALEETIEHYDDLLREAKSRPQQFIKTVFGRERMAERIVDKLVSCFHIDTFLRTDQSVEKSIIIRKLSTSFDEFRLLFKVNEIFSLYLCALLKHDKLSNPLDLLPHCSLQPILDCPEALEVLYSLIFNRLPKPLRGEHLEALLRILLDAGNPLTSRLAQHPCCPAFVKDLLEYAADRNCSHSNLILVSAIIVTISDDPRTADDESIRNAIHLALSDKMGHLLRQVAIFLLAISRGPRSRAILKGILCKGLAERFIGLLDASKDTVTLGLITECIISLSTDPIVTKLIGQQLTLSMNIITRWLNGFGLEMIYMLKICNSLNLSVRQDLLQECYTCLIKSGNRIESNWEIFSASINAFPLLSNLKVCNIDNLCTLLDDPSISEIERLELSRLLVMLAHYQVVPQDALRLANLVILAYGSVKHQDISISCYHNYCKNVFELKILERKHSEETNELSKLLNKTKQELLLAQNTNNEISLSERLLTVKLSEALELVNLSNGRTTELEALVADLEAANKNMLKTNDCLKNQLSATEEKATIFCRNYEQSKEVLIEQKQKADHDFCELSKRNLEIEAKLQLLEKVHAKKLEEQAAAIYENTMLRVENERLASEIDKMNRSNENITVLNREIIQSVKNENERLDNEMTELKENMLIIQNEKISLFTEIERLNAEMERLNSHMKALNDEIGALQSANQQLTREHIKKSEVMQVANEEISRLTCDNERLAQQEKILSESLQALTEQNDRNQQIIHRFKTLFNEI